MGNIISIIVAVLILSVMLFLHELGHYVAGRKLGFTVVEFSIFMGPRLFSFERNGIRYSLKAIPLGASVEFAGEYPDENETETNLKPGDFYERPRLYRAIVLLAGPMMNILTAFIAFLILFSSVGFFTTTISSTEENSLAKMHQIPDGYRIVSLNDYKVRTDMDFSIAQMTLEEGQDISLVLEDPSTKEEKNYTLSPETITQYVLGITLGANEGQKISIHGIDTQTNPNAEVFVLGDVIQKVNGQEVDANNFVETVQAEAGPEAMDITVLRGSDEVDLSVVPAAVERPAALGIQLVEGTKSIGQVLPYTFRYLFSYVRGTAKILSQVFTGQTRAQDSLTGPVGIVNMFSGVINQSSGIQVKLVQLLNLFAIISLALGTTNLLPIPPLDGGQLLILFIESIRRKRLGIKAQGLITMIGVAFVLLLALFSFGFDLMRIFRG